MTGTANRVLIVDDNHNLCKTLSDILEVKGFLPKCFSQGIPAVAWAEKEIPIVALIDLRLGDLPGLEVLKGVKTASPRTECIVMTGHASQASAIEAINLGAYSYVQKPFEIDQLLVTIQHAVEKYDAAIALHESEERFRRLAENAQDIIFRYEFTTQPCFTYLSPAAEAITGYTPEEFYADPELLFKITYPDDQQLLEEMARGGETLKKLVVLRWLHKNGSLIWVELRNAPIYDAQGNLIAIEGVARDITERKRAEENLKESQKQYRLLAENVSDVIWVVSMETEYFTYVSPSIYNLLGYGPDEILDQSMENILAPDSFIYLESVLPVRLNEFKQNPSKVYVDEIQHHKKDGTKVWVEATMRFVKNEDSGQVEIYGVSRDITERKHAREMLEKRVAQLLLLNDVGSQLTAELDVNRVLDLAVQLVQESFKYYHVGLFTISEAGDELILRSKAGALVDLIPGRHRLLTEQGIVGWVSTHGETILSNDVRLESRYVNLYPHLVKTQSELSIPIRIGNKILGVIDIQSPERDVFDENDVIVMETLANQIAIAFENARLYQSAQQELAERKRVEMMLRERVERLRNLHEIDQAILAAQSPHEIAGIVLGDVRRLIACDHASIVLFGEENAYLVEADGKITVQNGQDQPLDVAWAARLQTGEEIIIDDLLVQEPEHPIPVLQGILNRGIRSFISIPLLVQEDLIGIVNLASVQPGAFGPGHAEIVREMAVQVAIAIRQTQMVEQIQRHTAELEQRVAERTEELRQVNAMLTRASRMKDEFLASMSHELRTPLTGVLNLSEALQEQVYGALNEKQLKSLHMIEESGRHLLGLINDILDLSKIEAGQFELQIDTCSVGSTCQSSLQLIKGMAQKKHQNVSFAINPASIDMQADARRLKQMLVNLLSNAVKFTPTDGSIGLEVEGDADAQAVRFTVWDEGIGIAAEDLPKLFHPFTQLDSSLSRQHSGTGLGLALVQRMADLHGGSVSVESIYGKGSRFTITLPWKQAAFAQPPASAQKGSAFPLREVLTIEDIAMDAAHLTRLLMELGITNVVQSNGDGVVDLAAQSCPGAILLDIYLPDKLGWEVLASLKADSRTSSIPVIITSIEEDRARAATLGAGGYLVKPFSLDSLRTELEHATNRVFLNRGSVLVVGNTSPDPLILLAEDNEDNIAVYSDYLLAKNYRVVVARHGSEAISLAQEVHPDLILMDIQMPGMDGLEAIRHIRACMDADVAVTPIIALTALAMPGDRERCLAIGANEYLSKPVSLHDLIRAIQVQMNVSEPDQPDTVPGVL